MRNLRKSQAISQEELAGRAGLHRTYVCDIERGARNVSLKSIEKLANALGVPAAALFAEDATESPESGRSQDTFGGEPNPVGLRA